MNHYREWIIRYHGNLKKALQGTHIMFDIINERYAIIITHEGQIPFLRSLMQIEHMEESRQIHKVTPWIDPSQIISQEKKRRGVSGKGVTVGWIDHEININYENYNKNDGGTRILCMHDGIREYNTDQIQYIGKNKIREQKTDNLSLMDRCIGNQGIASNSDVIIVNWQKNIFHTADAIRSLRFIISKVLDTQKPLVIYFPFDISESTGNSLIREVVTNMILHGKITIASSLGTGNQNLEPNLGLNRSLYTRRDSLDNLGDLLNLLFQAPKMEEFRNINIAYEFAPEGAIIDAFIIDNSFHPNKTIILPPNTTIYPLNFPYSGVRGPVEEIKQLFVEQLGKTATASLPFILGNEPFNIMPTDFKTVSILNQPRLVKGTGTLIGIIDTGIDYTNPVFIDSNGETRIISIWDQTIGTSSPYGYGTVYDKEMINAALKDPEPFELVPHKDEWGHGTILAGIAAGSGRYGGGMYQGVAPEAELVVVKLKPADPVMQEIYYSRYNPLGFSALDIALALQFVADLSDQYQKPISICLPAGTNSGSHDGTNILDVVISNYSANPGICTVLAAGEEANQRHHASGDLNEGEEQEVELTIPKGQGGFIIEIWASFGDRLEVSLTPPEVIGETSPTILLNTAQTYNLSDTSFVWSQGSGFDINTGCQVIRFRLGNPPQGNWIITVKGLSISNGNYHIWIPKTGMTLPGTVLSPASPFTTISNTSTATGVIAVGCYDKKSLSPCSSSGRGFTRDNRVSPDFIVEGTNIPGPLPENKWGLVTGTSPASVIAAGVASLVYENQITRGEELANTVTMKAILVSNVKREPTVSYPNPSRGYGLLDANSNFYE